MSVFLFKKLAISSLFAVGLVSAAPADETITESQAKVIESNQKDAHVIAIGQNQTVLGVCHARMGPAADRWVDINLVTKTVTWAKGLTAQPVPDVIIQALQSMAPDCSLPKSARP